MQEVRKRRLEREIYKEAVIALSYKLRDPLFNSLYVTRVELSDSLRTAHVFVFSDSMKGPDVPDNVRRTLIAAGPFVTNLVNKALNLRRRIEIILFFDYGLMNQQKVEEIIEEIHRNEEKP